MDVVGSQEGQMPLFSDTQPEKEAQGDRSAKPEDVAVGIWQSRVSADSMGAVGQRPGWRRGASGEVSQLG
jgi:hypothetical protein